MAINTGRAVDETGATFETRSTAVARKWWPLGLIGIAQSMLIIDVTVVNVALPSIGADLALDRAGLTWVVTVYTLLFGSLLLFGGRLADAFGRRATFLIGLATFGVASLSSGLAPDGAILIVSRAAQGIGAAMLAPAALSMITTTYHGADRARALAVLSALGGSGAAVGVILGGVLAAGPGWQWIFLVNVPIAVAVGAAVLRVVQSDHGETGQGFDIPGAVLGTASVGLLLVGLIGAGEAGWTSPRTLATLAGALVAALALVAVETRSARPLLRLEALAVRRLGGPLTATLGAAGLLAGGFFLTSIYLQRVVGQGPLESGLTFVPVALALIVGAQIAAHVIVRNGPQRAAVIGLMAAAVGFGLLSRTPSATNVVVDVLPGFMLAAGGLGATFVSASTAAFARVDHRDAGMASGLVNTAHEVGFAFGVALLSTIAGASVAGGQAAGFQAAYAAAAVAALVIAVVAFAVLPNEKPEGGSSFAH